MHLSKWQHVIGDWAAKTFGHTPGKVEDIPARLLHLQEEVDELKEETCGEEIADCLILLLVIAQCLNVNVEIELARKFEKNKRRQWLAPDSRGVVHHV